MKMKKGDYVRSKKILPMRETFGFQSAGKIEGYVISTKPYLVLEYNDGEKKGQIGISHEAMDQFEIIKEAENE